MTDEMKMREFITQHEARVKPLGIESALAWWDNALTGSDEAAERAAAISARIWKIYANTDEYAFLKSIDPSTLNDPLIARQHDMLLRGYTGEQMPPETIDKLVALDKEVGQSYNNFRAEVNGQTMTENDVRKILRESDDLALREAAWKGSKALGGVVASRVLELVNTRNEVARSLGYRDHYVMSMELSELNEERVFAIFDLLAKQTDPMWHEWKTDFDKRQSERFGISVEELRPWHCPDQFFQVAPPSDLDLDTYFANKNLEELTTRFYTAIGLPIDEVLKRSDLYEKPGKNQHAFCTDIDREGDVRVLCNVRSTENWMCTMLHEFGHAVYDLYTDYRLPYFLRGPAHTLSTEAIAELMGRFSKDGAWLRTYAGVSAEEAERVAEISSEENRVQLLVMTRWVLVMCHFEREMYRDPSQDLNRLWWDMVEKYQGVHRPDNRNEPDWASKLHLALAPVYYQNYLLGEMFASQLLRYLRSSVVHGDAPDALVTSPKVGQWLREKIFEPGSTHSWEDGLAFATGERLNPAYFAEQLQR